MALPHDHDRFGRSHELIMGKLFGGKVKRSKKLDDFTIFDYVNK